MRNPYLVYLTLFLNLNVLTACGDDGPAVTVGDVIFDDAEMQRCYDDETSRYQDDWDVSIVEQLFCPYPMYDIDSLNGIEALTNLIGLTLLNNSGIVDYSPLVMLPAFIELDLRGSVIDREDFEFITGMNSLKYLNLSETELGDIRPLSQLDNLVVLVLNDSGITSGVASLTTLRGLLNGDFQLNPESPCADLEMLRQSLPQAVIRPLVPEPGISCRE